MTEETSFSNFMNQVIDIEAKLLVLLTSEIGQKLASGTINNREAAMLGAVAPAHLTAVLCSNRDDKNELRMIAANVWNEAVRQFDAEPSSNSEE